MPEGAQAAKDQQQLFVLPRHAMTEKEMAATPSGESLSRKVYGVFKCGNLPQKSNLPFEIFLEIDLLVWPAIDLADRTFLFKGHESLIASMPDDYTLDRIHYSSSDTAHS